MIKQTKWEMNVCGFKDPTDTKRNCDLCKKIIFCWDLFLLAAPSSLFRLWQCCFFFLLSCFEFYCLHVTFHIIFFKHLRYNLLSLNISINTVPRRHIYNGTRAFIVRPKKRSEKKYIFLRSTSIDEMWNGFVRAYTVPASEQVIANHIKGNMSSVHISNVCTLHRFLFSRKNICHFKCPRSYIHFHSRRVFLELTFLTMEKKFSNWINLHQTNGSWLDCLTHNKKKTLVN